MRRFRMAMASFVDIICFECFSQVAMVDADARGFYCETCGRHYKFVLCGKCESANQTRASGERGVGVCDWCWSGIRVTGLRHDDPATAEDWKAELTERGLGNPGGDDVIVGGFLLLGGSGFDIETDAICSVLILPDAVDVRAEVGGTGVATIPYGDMTGLDIAGGSSTRSGGFIGGGFGLQGAAEGMLVASILNSLTRKTTINTGLGISSVHGELLLNHNGISSSQLRRRLSPLFTRFNAAREKAAPAAIRADDPMSQLERLADLREKGLLTPGEFEAARSRLARQIGKDS